MGPGAPPNLTGMTPGEGEGSPRHGAGWKLALRLGVTGGLLALLLAKAPHPSELLPDGHVDTLLLLGGAVLATFVGVVLAAWRWQRVLHLFGLDLTVPTLTRHCLSGMFVGNVLPSTIGGDVVRVTRVGSETGSPSDAFGSVALERLTGFVALPFLVAAGIAFEPSVLGARHVWVPILVAGATLALLALILIAAGHPRLAGRFMHRENWTRYLGAVHRGVDRLRRDPRQILPVLSTAVAYQCSVVAVYALIFRALGIPVGYGALLVYAPAVLMLQVLPVSLAGLGVREGALVLLLHDTLMRNGLPDSRAVAAGLLWYGCTLLVSTLGAPAFALGGRRTAPTGELPVSAPPGRPK